MRAFFTFIFIQFYAIISLAQISEFGTPPSWQLEGTVSIPTKTLPLVNQTALLQEDEAVFGKAVPLRFGKGFSVDYSLKNAGKWIVLPNRGRVWQLKIQSKDAFSLNFIFKKFHLPKGGQLYLYNEDKSYLIGAFTSKNHKSYGGFATAPVKGQAIILEYFEPAQAEFEGEIELERVIHAYRDMFETAKAHLNDLDKNYGSSGVCNIDVNCPLGNNWQEAKRSVGMILTAGGTRWCSGVMLNNTAQDTTPYFLTANHCLDGNEQNWVVIFNYDSPTCNGPDASLVHSVSGTIPRATNAQSDFSLLELSVKPPDSYLVYYAGWDNRNIPTDTTVTIHHPNGDVKKISLNTDLLLNGTGYNGDHWRVTEWELGTTEGGSSGSPLFNASKRVIGQLHGGFASCANNDWDEYGKFSASWNGGGTLSTRLKDWLDPLNTNTPVLNGRYFSSVQFANNVEVNEILPFSDCGATQTPKIKVTNKGSNPITNLTVNYEFDGYVPMIYNWVGNLGLFQSTIIELPTVGLPIGNYTFRATVGLVNVTDQDFSDNTDSTSFNVSSLATNVSVNLQTDDWPEEIHYTVFDANGAIVFQVLQNALSGAIYENTLISQDLCLPDGCYKAVIYDTFGDGLSGGFGSAPGYFEIVERGLQLGIINGNFGNADTIDFCVPNAPVPPVPPLVNTKPIEKNLIDVNVFPNPTNGMLFYQTDTSPDYLIITDLAGKIIFEIQNPKEASITLHNQPRGVYFLVFGFGKQKVVKKIIRF